MLGDYGLQYNHFFLILQQNVRSWEFAQQVLDMEFKDFSDLIFAFSHMEGYLDKASDWEAIILDIFSQKLL